MYSFTFYFLYRLIYKVNCADAKCFASGFIMLMQLFQLYLVWESLEYFNIMDIDLFFWVDLNSSYLFRKLQMAPAIIIWMIILDIYFYKRFKKILAKYGDYTDRQLFSVKNCVFVFCTFLLPIILVIAMLNDK